MDSKKLERLAKIAGVSTATALQLYRGLSSTQTEQEKMKSTIQTEIGEYSRKRRVCGKYKKHGMRWVKRQLLQAQAPYFNRLLACNQFQTTSGGILPLYNHFDNTNNINYLPVYIFELDTVNNNGLNAYFGYRLYLNGATSPQSVQLATIGINGGTGTGSEKYAVEDYQNAGGNFTPAFTRATHVYSMIKLLLSGNTACPTKYDISVVSFPHDEFNPSYLFEQLGTQTGTSPTITSTYNGDLSVIQFWQDLALPYGFNPIMSANMGHVGRHIRYHKRQTFVIESTQTNEGTAGIPHQKEFDLFYKMDQEHKFDWKSLNPLGVASVNQAATEPTLNTGQVVASGPDYKYRKYLMIRALSKGETAGGAPVFAVNKYPSFDIHIRNKWMVKSV